MSNEKTKRGSEGKGKKKTKRRLFFMHTQTRERAEGRHQTEGNTRHRGRRRKALPIRRQKNNGQSGTLCPLYNRNPTGREDSSTLWNVYHRRKRRTYPQFETAPEDERNGHINNLKQPHILGTDGLP